MRKVIAYIGNLKIVATDLLGSLSPVTGAFLFSREAFLPFNLALQCLLEVCLLFRRIIPVTLSGTNEISPGKNAILILTTAKSTPPTS
jgi:hypothetical protein